VAFVGCGSRHVTLARRLLLQVELVRQSSDGDPMNEIYLLQNNEESGPYTLVQVRGMWSSGSITSRAKWRVEGLAEWLPFADLESRLLQSEKEQVATTKAPEERVKFTTVDGPVHRSSFAGGGCAIQGLGFVCLFAALASIFTVIGPIILFPLGLWLLIYGGKHASWFECPECGGKLPHGQVRTCQHCRAAF
jgi:hypothetical protein